MDKKVLFAWMILVLVALACSTGPSTPRPSLYLSPTSLPTQTERVLVVEVTTTPILIVITQTPILPTPPARWCVSALVAVHLRPSPNDRNYPIMQLEYGEQVIDQGGRDGKWWFVKYGSREGWINSDYLGAC